MTAKAHVSISPLATSSFLTMEYANFTGICTHDTQCCLSLSNSVFYHLLARIIGQAVSLLVGHLVRKLRNVWERILGIVMCSSKRIVNIKVQTQDFHPPMEKLWMKLHVEICVKSLKTLDANIGHLRSFYLF